MQIEGECFTGLKCSAIEVPCAENERTRMIGETARCGMECNGREDSGIENQTECAAQGIGGLAWREIDPVPRGELEVQRQKFESHD